MAERAGSRREELMAGRIFMWDGKDIRTLSPLEARVVLDTIRMSKTAVVDGEAVEILQAIANNKNSSSATLAGVKINEKTPVEGFQERQLEDFMASKSNYVRQYHCPCCGKMSDYKEQYIYMRVKE
jgi:hypothetical protein